MNQPPGSASRWKLIEKGLEFARYELGAGRYIIHPEVYLLRISPERFNIVAAVPPGFTAKGSPVNSDIRSLVKSLPGIAGINANFFDEQGRALGLVVMGGEVKQPIHRGGRVLTGIFGMRGAKPFIVHREQFDPSGVTMAVQAGPRLIDGGKVTKLSDAEEVSRRSGIAITRRGELILFATVLRFPGASLQEIQHMLLDPEFAVVEALNFDGGGSSQLFLDQVQGFPGETLISGGDSIPVGVVVVRKGG